VPDHLLQFGVVRSMPVDVAAGPAPGESLLRAQRPRFKLVGHLSLRNRAQRSSAGQAQAPRLQRRAEPLDEVGQLGVGVLTAHESGTAQRLAHQQAPVSAEQHSVLTSGPLDEMVVISVLVVRRVDAQEPKPAGQRAEVHVQQEERRPLQGLGPGSDDDVEPVLLLQPAPPGHRNLGHDQVPDLGQWHAHALDEMPNRGSRVVRKVELAALAAPARQQEAQCGVDAQPHRAGRHGGFRRPRSWRGVSLPLHGAGGRPLPSRGDVDGTRISHGSRLVHQRAGRQPFRQGRAALGPGVRDQLDTAIWGNVFTPDAACPDVTSGTLPGRADAERLVLALELFLEVLIALRCALCRLTTDEERHKQLADPMSLEVHDDRDPRPGVVG